MNGQYLWKRTEDAEFDLAELLCGFFMQWKQITVCALAAALILGTAGWIKGRNVLEGIESGKEGMNLTEAEAQAVEDAVWLESEMRGLETYLEHSILMQLDPYHKNKTVMLYCIKDAESKKLQTITESYINFVLNGGAADALLKNGNSEKMDKSCLAELISAYSKTYSFPYQNVMNAADESSLVTESLFYLEITGKDAEMAEKMALEMQNVLKAYSGEVKRSAGEHKLTLVSSMESVTADSSLLAQQHDKKAALISNKTNLRGMTDAFSKEQMAVYMESAGVKSDDGQEEMQISASETAESGERSSPDFRSVLKYFLLGLIGGIFAYGFVYTGLYIFRDAVKSTGEMKRLYTFPVYGGIPLEGRHSKNKAVLPASQQDTYGRTQMQTLNRIRLACQKRGIVKLCAASGFPLSAQEKKCMENMADQLKEWGISMTVAENAGMDTKVWDSMAETGNILLVCRAGRTTHRMIDDAMSFYMENEIAVSGAVLFI